MITHLTIIEYTPMEIKWPYDQLTCTIGYPIPIKQGHYVEMASKLKKKNILHQSYEMGNQIQPHKTIGSLINWHL